MSLEAHLLFMVQNAPTSEHVIQLEDWFLWTDEAIIITEYNQSFMDLNEFIRKKRHDCLTEDRVKSIMRNIINALLHCVKCGVHHCDTHLGNILINPDNMQIKLIDYGSSKYIMKGGKLAFWTLSPMTCLLQFTVDVFLNTGDVLFTGTDKNASEYIRRNAVSSKKAVLQGVSCLRFILQQLIDGLKIRVLSKGETNNKNEMLEKHTKLWYKWQ